MEEDECDVGVVEKVVMVRLRFQWWLWQCWWQQMFCCYSGEDGGGGEGGACGGREGTGGL